MTIEEQGTARNNVMYGSSHAIKNELLEEKLRELAVHRCPQIDILRKFTRDDPFITELLREPLSDMLFDERVSVWGNFVANIRESCYSDLLSQTTLAELWRYPVTIAQLCGHSKYKIVSIAGAPGSGKTTLAALCLYYLTLVRPTQLVIAASLDDFYFTKAERDARGIQWRAQPGSHDITRAVLLLRSIRSGATQIVIPRFNHASDDQGEPELVSRETNKLIFEGWFLGLRDFGYQQLNDFFDLSIYLDCPIQVAQRRRFRREEKIREASNGLRGYPPSEMAEYWSALLEPGVNKWVIPIRSFANMVVKFDEDGGSMAAIWQVTGGLHQ